MGKGQRPRVVKKPVKRQSGRRKVQLSTNVGVVVKVIEERNFGFLKCKTNENRNENGNKDVYFHFDRITSGSLCILTGDCIEYSLNDRESDKRPSVFHGKLIKGKKRNNDQLNDFLERVTDTIQNAGLEQCTSSEGMMKILSCLPAWKCIIESLNSEESVFKFMELVKIMNENLKSLQSHVKRIVQITAGSKLLDTNSSPLISHIERNVSRFSSNMRSFSVLRAFMLIIVARAPDKARNVVRLIGRFNENPNVASQLFYELLETITCNASSSIEALCWNELPLVPTTQEIEVFYFQIVPYLLTKRCSWKNH